jgi:hypothetical protein
MQQCVPGPYVPHAHDPHAPPATSHLEVTVAWQKEGWMLEQQQRRWRQEKQLVQQQQRQAQRQSIVQGREKEEYSSAPDEYDVSR